MFIIYPDGTFKSNWEKIMSLLVITTCIFTPYVMAFVPDFDLNMTIFDGCMNLLFLADIFVIFFSAYIDGDYNLIDDYNVIAANYCTGWFLIDLISIIPFDLILMTTGSFNRLARFARIGKLYKLIKMARMAKVLKIGKIKNKFVKNMVIMLKISSGFERLMILAIVFLLLQHVVCFIWIFIARFNPG